MSAERPQAGQRWRHYNGTVYTIVTLAVWEATGEEVVVYGALMGDGTGVWVRPLREWQGLRDNGVTPRFVRIADTEDA